MYIYIYIYIYTYRIHHNESKGLFKLLDGDRSGGLSQEELTYELTNNSTKTLYEGISMIDNNTSSYTVVRVHYIRRQIGHPVPGGASGPTTYNDYDYDYDNDTTTTTTTTTITTTTTTTTTYNSNTTIT